MEELIGFIFIRSLIRTLGLYTRYFFFRLIGKKRMLKTLQGDYSKDEYLYLGKNFTQDILNTIIGIIIFCFLTLFIVSIVFRN